MKPLQAAVSLDRIGEDLPSDLVAIMCASHTGEPEHIRAVRLLLRRAQVPVGALGCPPALPEGPDDVRGFARPARIAHNCSGKHAGMLFACSRRGWDLASYLAPRHPLQRAVLRAVRRGTGIDRPVIGVDGCGVPVHGLPLWAMATLFARLARPEHLGPEADGAARAVQAMRAHPLLIRGRGRPDSVIMDRVPGVVSKFGAEAVHCAAVLEEGIGVAVRVEDGAERASAPALIRALEDLGAISPRQLERLRGVARPPVLGGGRTVGEVRAAFWLRRARG